MKTFNRDTKGFIEGVTEYIRKDGKAQSILPRVRSLLTKVTAGAKKERVAQVSSAVVLTGPERATVRRVIEKILGREIECQFTTDAALLGGMKVTVADWVVDTSLSTQLESITQSLTL